MSAQLPRYSRSKLLFLMVALLCPTAATAQPSLLDFEEDLSALQACLGPENKSVAQLRNGLTTNWGKSPRGALLPPPPREYVESLHRDVRACRAARKVKDRAHRQEAFEAIRNDLAVKVSDCRRFGMGRMVPVRVTTLRGATPENGWEVFYRWDCFCSADLQPDELRAPLLTSPSTFQLPPGTYYFRAHKKADLPPPGDTSAVRITVGMQSSAEIQLPIP